MARPLKPSRPWHCVSVITLPEAEEAVAELMERQFEQAPSTWQNLELGTTVVSLYTDRPVAELRSMKSALRDGVKNLGEFDLKVGPARVSVKRVRPRDWSESWKRHFKPMEFGRALLVKPTWSRRAPKPGQQVVLLDPGLSFGTGQHATTRFCLEQLVLQRHPGRPQSFCDMGTGSGILAIAAAKLGYSPVRCFDFDRDCVRIARENAGLNDVSRAVKPAFGDVTRLPLQPAIQYDTVCANLIYDLLLSQRDRILAHLRPGGTLVLAGILATQFKQVADAYEDMGLQLVDSKIEKEWRSGTFRQSAATMPRIRKQS